MRDEVGSVIATVTENLGGANQSVSLTSYDAWGKARATTGSAAYEDLAPGSFYSPTPSGQEEGFAGHENLTDMSELRRCVFHAKPVTHFTLCRSGISPDAGRRFYDMAVTQ